MGDLDAAAAEAEAGLLVAAQLTATQMSMPLLSVLTTIAVRRDELSAAQHYLQEMQDLAEAGVTAPPEDYAWAAATVHCAAGRPELALRALADVYDRMPGRVLIYATDAGAAPTLVRIALAAGDRTRAETAADAIRGLSKGNPTVASLVGAAEHARGLLTGDRGALRAAVNTLRPTGRRLDLARTLEDSGRAECDAGARDVGMALLTEAIAQYRAGAAHHDVRRAEQRLGALEGRPARDPRPAPSSSRPSSPLSLLTDAELRVVQTVALGLSNRGTADELSISRHTVDSHLRSAFRKLGVNSRVELTRIVLTEDDPRLGPER